MHKGYFASPSSDWHPHIGMTKHRFGGMGRIIVPSFFITFALKMTGTIWWHLGHSPKYAILLNCGFNSRIIFMLSFSSVDWRLAIFREYFWLSTKCGYHFFLNSKNFIIFAHEGCGDYLNNATPLLCHPVQIFRAHSPKEWALLLWMVTKLAFTLCLITNLLFTRCLKLGKTLFHQLFDDSRK